MVTDAKLLGPNSGADNHAPTNMTFPTSGMWKLDAYIDGKLFGSVYVKVENKVPGSLRCEPGISLFTYDNRQFIICMLI